MNADGHPVETQCDQDPAVLLVPPPSAHGRLSGTSVLARHLAASGARARFRLLAPPGIGDAGSAVVETVYRGGKLAATARLVGRLIRPDGCAIHHFFFAPHGPAVAVARGALMLSRKRSVHTIPSQPADDADLKRLVFADRTVVLSDATALLLASAGVETPTVIRPAVPVPPRPADRAQCRARLASQMPGVGGGDGPLFLYAGDLAFSDGATTFVEAAIGLQESAPDARFVLACRGKTPEGRARGEALQRRVNDQNLEDSILFAGVVRDMPSLLGAADAVVLAVDTLYAKMDTPLVLLEAMALGVGVIVSDLPRLAELAGLGQGALVVRRSDPGALADAMGELASDRSKGHRLGEEARSTVETHFSVGGMAAQYAALYREVLRA